MKFTKKITRKLVYPAILNLGLEKAFPYFSKHSIFNILYHGVATSNDDLYYPRHINMDIFEKHLKYISKNYEVLSIPDAFQMYRNQIKPKRKAITISFDDGYKNNLDIALPLLEKYNIKATFFVSGLCVDHSRIPVLWPDIVACLNHFYKDKVISIGSLEFKNMVELSSKLDLRNYLKKLGASERDLVLNKLYTDYKLSEKLKEIPLEFWELLSVKDIQKLASSKLVDIGSHGYAHYNLGNINIADALTDMVQSKSQLEASVNKEVNMIAYPDGSYTPEVKKHATNIGYVNQLAVNYLYPEDKDDTCILNRFGVGVKTTVESSMFFMNKAYYSKGYN